MYEGNDESGRMSTIFCVKPVCFCSILELVSLLPFFLVLISIRVLVVQFHLVPQLAEKGQEGGCRSGFGGKKIRGWLDSSCDAIVRLLDTHCTVLWLPFSSRNVHPLPH